MGIIVLSPFMLATALAIKLYDGGPAIYKQVRLTKNGKEFKIYKFRSMKVDAEKDGVARLSTGDKDDRITPIGHIIRKFRLDEFPQLFNILKGDMSIVGPRPLLVRYLPLYNASQRRRHEVRPGLTGYAQVHGRNAISWEERFRLDVEYVDKVRFVEDVKIIFLTVKAVLKREGISSETSATMEEFFGTTSVK
jgi:lipopolysaccharide/colanic/teichoic acid biosynthesis glycosyltransferase